jgi:hypothetical protein
MPLYPLVPGMPAMDEFDKRVNSIGCRHAIAFFARRLLAIAVILYFAIAAYGHYSKNAANEKAREQSCPCDECDCAAPSPTQ